MIGLQNSDSIVEREQKILKVFSQYFIMERNVVGWFEIPVEDMNRAVEFYNKLFGWTIEAKPFGEDQMAMFPIDFEKDLPGAGGCLFKGKETQPGSSGVMVYFTSPSGDCANELATLKEMNAKILSEKYEIPDGHGFMIMCEDSEGNRIAIHSNK